MVSTAPVTFYKHAPDVLAWGVLPAFRRYELRQARYREAAPFLADLHARKGAPLRVLDVGAGNGEMKLYAEAAGARARWLAIERDPERARNLRARGYDEVRDDVDLEAGPLSLPDRAFDAIVAMHVLEHLENAPALIAECRRALVPGGRFIVGVPMHLPPIAWLARAKYRLFGRKPGRHCWFHTRRTLHAWFSPAGFRVLDVRGFRLVSARRILPLEDWEWFSRASLALGRALPYLTPEVNVVAEPV
jgi:SAM-dependent methyltransferase